MRVPRESPVAPGNEDELLDEALRKAGRARFLDGSFVEPLRVLLGSLAAAPLNAAGRFSMRARIVDLLVNRLRLEDYLDRHPEIHAEEIVAPCIVVGLPRTGTTMLHRLLSCDPNVTTLAWWESRNPTPFPDTKWNAADPRVAAARVQVQAILAAAPQLATMHPWDAEGPDEEFFLLEHSFYTFYSTVPVLMPAYASWAATQDQTVAYRYLRLMLQFLQWQKRQAGRLRKRWVLKAPRHLGFMEYLFRVFPDARIVQTHRDPVETIPSIASLYYAMWQMVGDEIDPRLVGAWSQAHWAEALRHCMRVRDATPAGRFIDIDFRAQVRDAIGEVRRIYQFLGLELSADTERQMRWWVEENRRDKRAPHEYTLDMFGLTAEGLRSSFAEYRRRYIAPNGVGRK
ncbi:MAG: sulfotransferase [Candidatus Binatia bacterium]